MIPRALETIAFSSAWGRQMRFITGPRQSGKTTLARAFLKAHGDRAFYYNWEDRSLKLRFIRDSAFLQGDLLAAGGRKKKRWVCYDEIHKLSRWKNILKAHFDAHEGNVHFIVTGSARLDLFRRAGDSLTGRYFPFRLFPLNLFEITRQPHRSLPFNNLARSFIERQVSDSRKSDQESMETLLTFGGFPEPFLKASTRFLTLWHRNYLERLIKGDLRDLTRIEDLDHIATLVTLLPERIGNPLSLNSLRNDLLVSYDAVQNYLRALRLSYFVFELPAYSKKINRAIKKEKKIYFHDWSLVPDEGRRFENYVACELLSWFSAWHDAGRGSFELCYVRRRDGKECDFLVLKDSRPWLLLEAKLRSGPMDSHLYYFANALGGIPLVQLVRESGVLHVGDENDYSISASRFLSA